ncbi:MAG: PAS domain S-box protein [Gallionella sp.]|nr:MAG: PAS domain S-box protein [Gallionella sp.]
MKPPNQKPTLVHGELEILAKQRTADISDANERLQHEISGHKRIELALQESERRFRAIAQSANDAIITADSSGNVVNWNSCAERLFGYTEAEIGGQSLARLIPERFRERHLAGLARVAAGGEPHVMGKTVELAGLRKDGGEFPLELSLAQWETAAGRFFTAIIRDITERKENERKIRRLTQLYAALSQCNQAIVRCANEEELFPQICRDAVQFGGFKMAWVGLLDEADRLVKPAASYGEGAEYLEGIRVPVDAASMFWCGLTGAAIEDNQPCWCQDFLDDPRSALYRGYAKNAGWYASASLPLLCEGRQVGSLMLYAGAVNAFDGDARKLLTEMATDISFALGNFAREEKRRQAEAAVRQLNTELENKVAARTAELAQAWIDAEQANRAKSDFLATMSHEIRTPMNGVIGMIDVLRQSSLNGQQMEMANIIHDSAYALLAVINDILDFSKIEAGKLQIDRVPMDAADVVEGVCETMDRLALKKGVELTLFTDPAIPAGVLGDPGRLRQVLINLANNAIKFSSKQDRPGRVSVRAILAENGLAGSNPEQVTLEFHVADNGIGIDRATMSRLFTAFTQADTSTTRNFGGTGLGLAISRHLVKLMDGEIKVQSEQGKGSLFSVYLTFMRLAEQPDASPAAWPWVAGLPCLVVDDPDGIAGDLAAYLAYGKALVERAADTATARQWIADRLPGLYVVVVGVAAVDPPPATPLLDGLRAAAHARPDLDVRFVAIGRGGRRRCRVEAHGLVTMDAEVMHRLAFLEAVAVAAGRAEERRWGELDAHAGAAPAPLSREEARRQGSLILVAEDNEINQRVILQQLALLARTADIVGNGQAALELWGSGDYAILLTDLHMPEMDGYELTAAIRAAEAGKTRMPIIAFTANALKGEAERCLAAGMDDYLGKPVQLASLKAMLEKWLPVAAEHAPVDVNVLKALVGDDPAVIREFLHDFRTSATGTAAELKAACNGGQAVQAGALAHKLKSSARSVGALALGDLCAEMEQSGKSGDAGALAALLPKFEAEMVAVDKYLDSSWKREGKLP